MLVDENSARVLELTKKLNVSNDDFIRTTDKKRHWPAVEKIWQTLNENDDLYKKEYEGLYCAGCEAFITKKDLDQAGKCRLHNALPEKIKEENYFFRLSKYGDQIKKLIESDELKIIPEVRKKELLALIKEGVQDVSFSRPSSSLNWGIPVPSDPSQTIYVWADALSNYISALGFGSQDEKLFKQYWPADIHLIGKDILRFHALIWPGILFSAKLLPPKGILVHGFISSGGQKMSKTLGNVIDPFEIIKKYGVDALRYYLSREIPTTGDGDFTWEKFNERYDADLASGLGNLVARTFKMVEKYCDGKIPQISQNPDTHPLRIDEKIYNWKKTWQDVDENIAHFKFNEALFSIWQFIAEANKYIDQTEPWALAENGKQEELNWALYGVLDAIHQLAWQIYIFMPETSLKIAKALSIKGLLAKKPQYKDSWTNLKSGTALKSIDPLFPRIE